MKLLAFIFEQSSYEHFNGLKLSAALEEFSITSRFLGSKIVLKKISF